MVRGVVEKLLSDQEERQAAEQREGTRPKTTERNTKTTPSGGKKRMPLVAFPTSNRAATEVTPTLSSNTRLASYDHPWGRWGAEPR